MLVLAVGWGTLGTAGCQVPVVGMGQIRPRDYPVALREGEGLLSEIEWMSWCWIFFFANDKRL